METIKNYLETMFANLPNTLEVRQAKDELYSMMEDKYSELISEGKAENEAIGIVISEFGNLDELAESLGIDKVVTEMVVSDRRLISQTEADEYVSAAFRHRFLIGLGVLFCIYSVIGPIIFAPISKLLGFAAFEAIGVAMLFLFVAAGVGLLIYSSYHMNSWKFIDKEPCTIDYATAEHLSREKNDDLPLKGMLLTMGIILCIISFIPVIILDTIFANKMIVLTEGFAPAMIFAGVGIGVLMMILAGAKDDAYSKLLSLNDAATVAGNYEPVKKEIKRYSTKAAKYVRKDYWRVVLCLYLILSFLSFNWGSTWIIWPLAAILQKPIIDMFKEKEGK